MPEERNLQDEVWNELKDVRGRGLAGLNDPLPKKKIATPLLETAAARVLEHRSSLSRIDAIELLL